MKAVQPNRREFLAAAGAAFSAPYFIPKGVFGANERITTAHIGGGGMGGHHLRDMVRRRGRGQVNIAAVCDIDEKRLANAVKTAGKGVIPYHDYRYILERKDIDAVVFATPDHWHGVQTVHACESGKHVYVEKPACCTIEEGKAMVAAAKNNKVSVQVGSQGRSQPDAGQRSTGGTGLGYVVGSVALASL